MKTKGLHGGHYRKTDNPRRNPDNSRRKMSGLPPSSLLPFPCSLFPVHCPLAARESPSDQSVQRCRSRPPSLRSSPTRSSGKYGGNPGRPSPDTRHRNAGIRFLFGMCQSPAGIDCIANTRPSAEPCGNWDTQIPLFVAACRIPSVLLHT